MTERDYVICVRVDALYAEATPSCRLREAIALTLRHGQIPPCTGVTLLVTDDESVHKLNKRFRGVDAPTDVLSFPAVDDLSELVQAGEEEPYLGDVVVAFPYTAAQAQEDGHDIGDVLVLLAVHGTLHLLGYDHDTPQRQAEMWARQESLLRELGVPPGVMPPLYDFPAEDDDEAT